MRDQKLKIRKSRPVWSTVIVAALAAPIVLTMAVFFWRADGAAPLKPIRVLTGEWSPYSGADLPDYGLASAIVTTALREAGYEPQLQFVPWKLALPTAARAETNADIRVSYPWYYKESRAEEFYYSVPIMQVQMGLFFDRKRNPEVARARSLKEISHLRTILIEGYRYHADIEAAFLNRVTEPDIIAAFDRLKRDPSVHLIPEAMEVGRYTIRRHFPELVSRVAMNPFIRCELDLHLIASKRNPHNKRLIDKVDRNLLALEESNAANGILSATQHRINQEQAVRLSPFGDDGVVEARLGIDDDVVILPIGTRAVVEEWGDIFLLPSECSDSGGARFRTRVYLIDGPLEGETVYIDGRCIEFP